MLRLFPTPALACEPRGIYDELRLPLGPAGRPGIALNIVTSVDGKAALGGGAAKLGSSLDHHLMRALRAAHDAVLIGAGTLRAEPVDPRVGASWHTARARRGQPPEPLAVLLSASGRAPLERRYFAHPEVRRLVVIGNGVPSADRAPLERVSGVLVAPTALPHPEWIARTLYTEYGVRHLLLEGGPNVNGAFLAAGLVDTLFWTVAPKLAGGGESTTMVSGPALPEAAELALESAYLHEDELFLRYRMARAALGASAPGLAP